MMRNNDEQKNGSGEANNNHFKQKVVPRKEPDFITRGGFNGSDEANNNHFKQKVVPRKEPDFITRGGFNVRERRKLAKQGICNIDDDINKYVSSVLPKAVMEVESKNKDTLPIGHFLSQVCETLLDMKFIAKNNIDRDLALKLLELSINRDEQIEKNILPDFDINVVTDLFMMHQNIKKGMSISR